MEERITERIRQFLEAQLDGKGRPQLLFELTGIAPETWRKFFLGKQRATLYMLQQVCIHWPEYAFWLSTGISDKEHGHMKVAAKEVFQEVRNANISTRKVFEERIKYDDFSGGDAKGIRSALHALADYGFLEDKEEYSPRSISRVEFFEKLRKIIFFLENYILDLHIDDSINAFNTMLKEIHGVEEFAHEKDELDAYNEAISVFKGFKDELDKRSKWLIQNASANET
jgi:hypothetical protein